MAELDKLVNEVVTHVADKLYKPGKGFERLKPMVMKGKREDVRAILLEVSRDGIEQHKAFNSILGACA